MSAVETLTQVLPDTQALWRNGLSSACQLLSEIQTTAPRTDIAVTISMIIPSIVAVSLAVPEYLDDTAP